MERDQNVSPSTCVDAAAWFVRSDANTRRRLVEWAGWATSYVPNGQAEFVDKLGNQTQVRQTTTLDHQNGSPRAGSCSGLLTSHAWLKRRR